VDRARHWPTGCVPLLWASIGLMLAGLLSIRQSPLAGASSAYLATKEINGCVIVSDPTREHRTHCPHADLSKAELSHADLTFADLVGADFFVADLANADLSYANLTSASLLGANLFHVRFRTKFCSTLLPNGEREINDC
jgi:uncharacterized protein YjbI with pentapeptide repeats